MLPTKEEKSRIQEAQAANPDLPLGSAEQFLLTLTSISELPARLKLWAFKLDFENSEKVSKNFHSVHSLIFLLLNNYNLTIIKNFYQFCELSILKLHNFFCKILYDRENCKSYNLSHLYNMLIISYNYFLIYK